MHRQNSQKYNISNPKLKSILGFSISLVWLLLDDSLQVCLGISSPLHPSPGMFGHLFPPASCLSFSPSSSSTRLMQVLTQATWSIPFVQRGNYSLSIVVVGNKVPLSNAGHLQLWWVFFLLEHWCHSNPPTSSTCSIIHDPSYSSSPPSEHWMKSNRVVHSLGLLVTIPFIQSIFFR